ncbi:MAG: hypothetical protein IJ727_04915 [Treponema sp.]|nr:hypothetical protein [Treponema sp.]
MANKKNQLKKQDKKPATERNNIFNDTIKELQKLKFLEVPINKNLSDLSAVPTISHPVKTNEKPLMKC